MLYLFVASCFASRKLLTGQIICNEANSNVVVGQSHLLPEILVSGTLSMLSSCLNMCLPSTVLGQLQHKNTRSTHPKDRNAYRVRGNTTPETFVIIFLLNCGWGRQLWVMISISADCWYILLSDIQVCNRACS